MEKTAVDAAVRREEVPGAPPPSAAPVRVLHVLRPATGGMSAHVLEVCKGLRDLGLEIELACPRDWVSVSDARALGLATHTIDLVGPLSPLDDLRGAFQIRRLIKTGHFDVVHAHGFKAGLVARVGARLGGCRALVVTAHNHVMYRDDISRFTKWRYRFVERALSRFTSKIIAVSDSLRDELIEAYGIAPGRVITIHNGVDVTRFLDGARFERAAAYAAPSEGTLVVGAAARFAPQKDLHTLIEAAAIIGRHRDDVLFLLGGDGPLKGELEAAIAAAGLEERMRMVGFVSDMPAFLAALDIYVSSSLSEGLPLTFVEVGACALPIVATDAGGTAEIVRDDVNGLLVPLADPSVLAAAIERVLDDPDLRASLGAEGRRIALEEFSPKVMAEKTSAVYAEALHR